MDLWINGGMHGGTYGSGEIERLVHGGKYKVILGIHICNNMGCLIALISHV